MLFSPERLKRSILFIGTAIAVAIAAGIFLGHWLRNGPAAVTDDVRRIGTFQVERVVDGDTIVVATAGGNEKVRLIGINTPETVDPRKPVECFGKEASRRTHELVEGKTVRLEADPQAGDRDKYGRLLRYVYLADGTDVNELLVREGFAHENGYGRNYAKREQFRTAEAEARDARRGLWDPQACTQEDPPPAPSHRPHRRHR